jgi:3-hydroxybutyryl-CoA dehydratase
MNAYTWPELLIGLSDAFDVDLDVGMIAAFAVLSGDVNPLHTNRDHAIGLGFSDTVAFGLLTTAFYSRLVGVHLPGKFALLHGIRVDFVEPAYPRDRLRVSGEITHLNEAFHRIEMRAMIENQHARVVSRARIKVGLVGS